jgi:hypothetical protein
MDLKFVYMLNCIGLKFYISSKVKNKMFNSNAINVITYQTQWIYGARNTQLQKILDLELFQTPPYLV